MLEAYACGGVALPRPGLGQHRGAGPFEPTCNQNWLGHALRTVASKKKYEPEQKSKVDKTNYKYADKERFYPRGQPIAHSYQ